MSQIQTIDPGIEKTARVHSILLGAVSPRPVAFASTMDKGGNPNLSPFSFFNCFSAKPPILIFSPARRVRDNTTKHTLENILEVPEVVINVVSYNMVNQASLSSVEYPKGINEFVKSGFKPIPSQKIKPFRVEASPVQMECIVKQVIPLGSEGGAGNLIVCEVVLIHLQEEILDADGKIDPWKAGLVGRMGGDYYCKPTEDSIFEVEKPNTRISMGIDRLPSEIQASKILTGNNLAQLANLVEQPKKDEDFLLNNSDLKSIFTSSETHPELLRSKLHFLAKKMLDKGMVQEAWQILLSS